MQIKLRLDPETLRLGVELFFCVGIPATGLVQFCDPCSSGTKGRVDKAPKSLL